VGKDTTTASRRAARTALPADSEGGDQVIMQSGASVD